MVPQQCDCAERKAQLQLPTVTAAQGLMPEIAQRNSVGGSRFWSRSTPLPCLFQAEFLCCAAEWLLRTVSTIAISIYLPVPNTWILSLHYLGNCKFWIAKRPLGRTPGNEVGKARSCTNTSALCQHLYLHWTLGRPQDLCVGERGNVSQHHS